MNESYFKKKLSYPGLRRKLRLTAPEAFLEVS